MPASEPANFLSDDSLLGSTIIFPIFTVIFAFLGFFAIVADMGFYNVAVREISKYPEKAKDIMGNIFSLRVIFALIFLALAPLVGYLVPVYSEGVKIGILFGPWSSFLF